MLVCPTQTYTYIHTLSRTQFGILTHTCTNCFPDVTHTYPHSRMPTCTRAYTIYRYECTTTPTVVQIYAHTYTTNRHTTLHSIYEMCVHACTPSPPANTNTFTNTKKRVCTLTNTHESRSQARMRINTDHVLSSAVCPFVMPASCHQVVASELARCPTKIGCGQPYSWHLLCQICPEEQPLCPPGGLAPHSGTLHNGACSLSPASAGWGEAGPEGGWGVPGSVPEFT